MEGDAVGLEPEADRGLDELARQAGWQPNFFDSGQSAPRPSVRRRKQTLDPGGGVGDGVQVRDGIRSVEPDSALVEVRDILLLLDGVPIAHALRRDAQPDQLVELVAAGDIEAGAQVAEQLEDPVVGIGLHGVVDLREGQILPEFLVPGPDHVEIEDEAGRLLTRGEGLDPFEFLRRDEILEGEAVSRDRRAGPGHSPLLPRPDAAPRPVSPVEPILQDRARRAYSSGGAESRAKRSKKWLSARPMNFLSDSRSSASR